MVNERRPKPHHLLDAIDDFEVTVAAHVGDDHVDGVGSDIDGTEAHG